MNRGTVLVLILVLVIWWTSDVDSARPPVWTGGCGGKGTPGCEGAPAPDATATDAVRGPNKWWAPCPPGYVQIPPFGDCLPPNTTGRPIYIY